MKVRQGTGRGNGSDVEYTLVVNSRDTALKVSVASTLTGEAETILSIANVIYIPKDAKIEVAVDKPSGIIALSPLDCTVTVELL